MKHICSSIILLLSVITISSKSYSQNDFPVLEDRYFGQKPPGLTSEIFAPDTPDMVSTEGYSKSGGKFTPDMKKFYFVRKGGKYEKRTLLVIQYKNHRWGSESVVPTNIIFPAFFSKDGDIMYSGNKYTERTDTGWSEIKSLGAPFKDIRIMGISASSKGTYYFDFAEMKGNGYIRYSRLIDGKREKPQKLSKAINTGKWIAHPFIAPDESYLIWDAEKENGYGDNDLYISFRQKDGSWGAAINLGEKINTTFEESGGHVTPDGKYLMFNRNSKIHWVDAQIIENLRPK